jgi:PAS domain S-box-containing protein
MADPGPDDGAGSADDPTQQGLFLARLADALKGLTDPGDVLAAAARMLGEHLGADRCAYAEVEADEDHFVITGDYTRGDMPGIRGRFAMSAFGAEALRLMREDQPYVVSDVLADARVGEADRAAYERTQIRAVISVPLHKQGRFVAGMAVHQRTPRRWTDGDVALVQAVAHRCWESLERSRTVQALREREERYHALFTSIDEGFCVCEMLVDEDGTPFDYRFVEVNAAFEALTGLVNPVGRTARELVPGLEDHWVQTYARVAFGGEPFRFQQGSEAMGRWFDVYATPVGPRRRGEFALVFTNITEQRRAQQLLLEARRQAESRAEEAARLAAQLQDQAVELELQVDQSRQLAAELEVANEALRDTNLQLTAHTLALAESEERFRNMADNAPVMVWVTDPTGYCTYLNRRWHEFTGQTVEEARGFGWVNATHPDDAARTHHAFVQANAGRAQFRVEYRLRTADGGYRWAIDAAAPRFGAGGEFLGYVGSVIDIHERKQMEEERERLLLEAHTARDDAERARAAAEEASEAKSVFMATMSHELRTPLNAMIGYADLLQMGIPDPISPRAGEQVSRIGVAARHLLQLIEEILTFSRLEAGREVVEAEPVSLAGLVHEVRVIVEPLAREKGLHWSVHRAPGVDVIRTDPRKLRQILINLVGNAVKFTGQGKVELAIDRGGGWVVFRVRDTGSGIAPEHLEVIFQPFHQLVTDRSRRAHGTGLGLTVSLGLTRLLGGDLTVESTPGQGSTFILRLPADPSDASTAAPAVP